MEYIPLNKLPNKYPDISNYQWEDGNYIVLDGEYPNNYIAFKKPFLGQLNWVSETKFKFIVEIKTSNTDPYSKFYTSEAYYKELETALLDNNPYFVKQSFKKENIITVNISDALAIFSNRNTAEEGKYGVKMIRNFFCESDLNKYPNSGLNYENLVRYLDWLLDTSKPYNIDEGGVLPTTTNSKYELLKYNEDLGIYQSQAEYDYYFAVIQLNEIIKLSQAAIDELRKVYANPTQEGIDRVGKYFASLGAAGVAFGGAAILGAFSAAALTTAAGSVIIATTAGLVSVPAGSAAALAGTVGIGASATSAAASAAAASAPAGPIIAGIVIIVAFFTALLIGSAKQKQQERQRDEALAKVRAWCLTEISKLEKDLENYKFLLKELVDSNKEAPKVENSSTQANGNPILQPPMFDYDDGRIQTNIRLGNRLFRFR